VADRSRGKKFKLGGKLCSNANLGLVTNTDKKGPLPKKGEHQTTFMIPEYGLGLKSHHAMRRI